MLTIEKINYVGYSFRWHKARRRLMNAQKASMEGRAASYHTWLHDELYLLYFFRYVSIISESPLYLCEVQVLAAAHDQISPHQCNPEATVESRKSLPAAHHNKCIHIDTNKKMSFTDSVNFCKSKGLNLIHNKTASDVFSYMFVR